MSEDRYYWLKLKKDFFKRHDIEIVEAMPNGKDYILFYLKLLCESLDHNGELRFSDTIPYNADMLSALTRTNVDVVRGAISVFKELGMLEIWDNETIFMSELHKMTGSETKYAEKQRRYRLTHQKVDNVSSMYPQCIEMSDKRIENRDKSIESRDKSIKKPIVDVFKDYAGENKDLYETLKDFEQMRTKVKKPLTDRAKKMLVNKLDKYPEDKRIKVLEQSILHSWIDIYDLKESGNDPKPKEVRNNGVGF